MLPRDLKLAISSGSNKAYSTALATKHAFPCWKFLIHASASKGAPSSTKAGINAGTPIWGSALLSAKVCVTLASLPPL